MKKDLSFFRVLSKSNITFLSSPTFWRERKSRKLCLISTQKSKKKGTKINSARNFVLSAELQAVRKCSKKDERYGKLPD